MLKQQVFDFPNRKIQPFPFNVVTLKNMTFYKNSLFTEVIKNQKN